MDKIDDNEYITIDITKYKKVMKDFEKSSMKDLDLIFRVSCWIYKIANFLSIVVFFSLLIAKYYFRYEFLFMDVYILIFISLFFISNLSLSSSENLSSKEYYFRQLERVKYNKEDNTLIYLNYNLDKYCMFFKIPLDGTVKVTYHTKKHEINFVGESIKCKFYKNKGDWTPCGKVKFLNYFKEDIVELLKEKAVDVEEI